MVHKLTGRLMGQTDKKKNVEVCEVVRERRTGKTSKYRHAKMKTHSGRD